jgi:hypothetical protein
VSVCNGRKGHLLGCLFCLRVFYSKGKGLALPAGREIHESFLVPVCNRREMFLSLSLLFALFLRVRHVYTGKAVLVEVSNGLWPTYVGSLLN